MDRAAEKGKKQRNKNGMDLLDLDLYVLCIIWQSPIVIQVIHSLHPFSYIVSNFTSIVSLSQSPLEIY